MISIHEQIRSAIRHLDSEGARRLIKDALQNQPDAELYYLASLLALNTEERIDYLEKSLSLDANHVEAASELNKLLTFPYVERRKASQANFRPILMTVGLSFVLILGLIGFLMQANNSQKHLPDDWAGEWLGSSISGEVGLINHELSIRQENGEIIGTSSGETPDGRADVYLRGHYENGVLRFETYGGSFSGWSGICHFVVTLEYRETAGTPYLTGTYETIPNAAGTCSYSGTMELERPE